MILNIIEWFIFGRSQILRRQQTQMMRDDETKIKLNRMTFANVTKLLLEKPVVSWHTPGTPDASDIVWHYLTNPANLADFSKVHGSNIGIVNSMQLEIFEIELLVCPLKGSWFGELRYQSFWAAWASCFSDPRLSLSGSDPTARWKQWMHTPWHSWSPGEAQTRKQLACKSCSMGSSPCQLWPCPLHWSRA